MAAAAAETLIPKDKRTAAPKLALKDVEEWNSPRRFERKDRRRQLLGDLVCPLQG
jgi:hypothetical protein